ncbi:phage tail tape measure protein [Vibrio parahaemolyticus]|uniref:phage tail tape measure protein n=1 Tax=Vibrio parahaemolyticus TaxID=670 RepID=UPI00215C93CD|nr:phage tail tape measure protein [Vibrio parahaemolyticus]MCR9868126.1 phage tail tape measure protein [Vibrio parahaemolyticus]
MSISKQSNGYALELLVGIQDEFSGKSKAIEQETKRLSKEVEELQKTTGDITKFKKAEKALDDLQKQQIKSKDAITKQRDVLKKLKKEAGDTKEIERQEHALKKLERQDRDTTASLREHERETRRLRRTLSDAGLDLSNLSADEAKLQSKVEKTTKALKEQTQALNKFGNASAQMEGLSDKLGVIGSITAAAGYTLYRGNDMAKHMLMYAAQTNTDISELKSDEQRKFRASLVADGATSGDIFTAMGLARTQGLDDKETNALTAATVRINQVFPDLDPQELSRSIATASKSFNVSIDEAAQAVMSVRQFSGDANHDLLDTFAEYSPLLGDDMSLDKFAASLAAGRKAGVWNYDKIADGMKELFQVRFKEQGEFVKLVGDDKTTGAIEAISDEKERKNVLTAALRLRHAVTTGQDSGDAYTAFMKSLMPVMEHDRGAIKPILEAAGGTILSEDIGVKGLTGMTEGAANPEKFIHEINLKELAQSTRTEAEKLADAGRASQSVVDESTANLIQSQDSLSTAIQDLSKTFTDFVIENPMAGHVSSAVETATLGAGGALAWKARGKILSWLTGKTIDVAAGAGAESALGATATRGMGMLSRFKLGTGIVSGGTAMYGLSLMPDFSPVKIDRADDRDDRASIFGFKTNETGYLGFDQNIIPKKVGLMDVWDEWFGDDKSDDVKRVENLVDSSNDTAMVTGQPTTPMIQIDFTPTITVELTGASEEQAQALSDSLVTALRNMTPELQQQLRDAMSDIMQSSDYLEH